MTTRRRLVGRQAPAALAALAAVGVITGCAAPPPTALSYCATQPPAGQDPMIVDDALCAQPSPQYQVIEQDVPDNDSSSFLLLSTGSYVPRSDLSSGRYRALPRGAQVRAGSQPARLVRPPSATPGKPTTITRGGLGVSSSSSGAKAGGSSGSSSGS